MFSLELCYGATILEKQAPDIPAGQIAITRFGFGCSETAKAV